MWWILLSVLLLGQISFAQDVVEEDTISLVINTPVTPKDFNETEKNQTGKIVLKATTKVRGYQIIIGEFDPAKKAKFQVHVVELEVVKDSNGAYTLTGKLFDEKSKKLINKVTYQNVEKIAYFRELEKLMNELFLPVEQERLRKTEEKKENPKKPPAVKIPPQPTESETANVNFKERIMALKFGVDNKIKEINEAKKPDPPKVTDSEGKQEEPKKSNAEAAINKVESELVFDKPPVKHPAFQNIKSQHKAGVLMKTLLTNSKHGVIDLDTSLRYTGFDYTYQRPVVLGADHFWQGDITLAKPQNEDEKYTFAPYVQFGGAYGYYFRSIGLFLRGGFDVDTLSFTNLPEEGKGLKMANPKIVHGLVGAQLAGVVFNQPIIAAVDYLKPFYFKGDNDLINEADLAGQQIRASFTLSDLYWHLNLKFDYYISSYEFAAEETTLTTSTSGYGVHVNYAF